MTLSVSVAAHALALLPLPAGAQALLPGSVAPPPPAQSMTTAVKAQRILTGADPTAAAVLAALAAPVLLAGAVSTVGGELARDKPLPRGVIEIDPGPAPSEGQGPSDVAPRRRKPVRTLSLLPPPDPAPWRDPPRPAPSDRDQSRHDALVRANETLTNAAMVAVGAAVGAAIITGIVSKQR